MILSSGWKDSKELLEMRSWEPEPAHFGKREGAATPTNAVWCGDQMQHAHMMLQKKALSTIWACLSQKVCRLSGEIQSNVQGNKPKKSAPTPNIFRHSFLSNSEFLLCLSCLLVCGYPLT